MSKFIEGLAILEKSFGHNKDNIVNIATIDLEPGELGQPRPAVRSVDAYYEDGTFYIITNAKSNKIQQVEKNDEVSLSATFEDSDGQVWLTSRAKGENLGHVLKPENAYIRKKLRSAFAVWYDAVNNEQDPHCCFMAVHLTHGIINVNHFTTLYHMDFVGKTAE